MKMKEKKILCPDCKTGAESLLIDPSSEVCPYISCYNGYSCAYYAPQEKQESNKIIKEKVRNYIKSFGKRK